MGALYHVQKVIFLGSNPSNASPENEPFTHCKSRTVLEKWIPALGLTIEQVEFMNVANYKTPQNKPLTTAQVYAEISRLRLVLVGRTIVTLGKTAATAADLVYRLESDSRRWPVVINLPHPSGMNRILNDQAKVAEILANARRQLQEKRHA